jgi:hypothetical protein
LQDGQINTKLRMRQRINKPPNTFVRPFVNQVSPEVELSEPLHAGMFDSEQRNRHGYGANLRELADRERETALVGIRRREPSNAVRTVPQHNSIFVDQLRGAFVSPRPRLRNKAQ